MESPSLPLHAFLEEIQLCVVGKSEAQITAQSRWLVPWPEHHAFMPREGEGWAGDASAGDPAAAPSSWLCHQDEQHHAAQRFSAPGERRGDGSLASSSSSSSARQCWPQAVGMSASGLLLILICLTGNPGCSSDLAGIACCLSDAFILQQQHLEFTNPERNCYSSFSASISFQSPGCRYPFTHLFVQSLGTLLSWGPGSGSQSFPGAGWAAAQEAESCLGEDQGCKGDEPGCGAAQAEWGSASLL